jgi:hypothetical protein
LSDPAGLASPSRPSLPFPAPRWCHHPCSRPPRGGPCVWPPARRGPTSPCPCSPRVRVGHPLPPRRCVRACVLATPFPPPPRRCVRVCVLATPFPPPPRRCVRVCVCVLATPFPPPPLPFPSSPFPLSRLPCPSRSSRHNPSPAHPCPSHPDTPALIHTGPRAALSSCHPATLTPSSTCPPALPAGPRATLPPVPPCRSCFQSDFGWHPPR